MQNRSLIADHPTVVFVDEGYRVQMHRDACWPHRPTLAARSRSENLAVRADGPAARAVQKKNVREIVASAFGQTPPGKSAIVAAHHQAVAAASPASVFVSEINRDQPR